MDATLLANLNSKVGENDVLYFLGDFCLGGTDQAKLYRDRIVCRNIHMIEGNHGPALRELKGAFCSVSLCDAGLASFLPRRPAPLRTFPRQTAGRAYLAVHRRWSRFT